MKIKEMYEDFLSEIYAKLVKTDVYKTDLFTYRLFHQDGDEIIAMYEKNGEFCTYEYLSDYNIRCR